MNDEQLNYTIDQIVRNIQEATDPKWLDDVANGATFGDQQFTLVADNPNCSVETLIELGKPVRDYSGWITETPVSVLEHIWSNERYPIGLLIGHTKNKDADISNVAKRVLKTRNVLDDLLDD